MKSLSSSYYFLLLRLKHSQRCIFEYQQSLFFVKVSNSFPGVHWRLRGTEDKFQRSVNLDGSEGGRNSAFYSIISVNNEVNYGLQTPKIFVNFNKYNYLYFFPLWRCGPTWAKASSFLRFLDHTQRRSTVGRTSLGEWSARRRDLYLTTHNVLHRQTSMPPGGIRTHNPSKRASVDPRPKPRGHWNRHYLYLIHLNTFFWQEIRRFYRMVKGIKI